MTSVRSAGSGVGTAALLLLSASPLCCVTVPPRGRAAAREAAYFAENRDLPPEVAKAIERGHVVVGMDPVQVWVVLGDTLRRTRYPGRPPAEVWIYPAHRLHQDQLRSHGASLFRLVFVDGRLALIEPM